MWSVMPPPVGSDPVADTGAPRLRLSWWPMTVAALLPNGPAPATTISGSSACPNEPVRWAARSRCRPVRGGGTAVVATVPVQLVNRHPRSSVAGRPTVPSGHRRGGGCDGCPTSTDHRAGGPSPTRMATVRGRSRAVNRSSASASFLTGPATTICTAFCLGRGILHIGQRGNPARPGPAADGGIVHNGHRHAPVDQLGHDGGHQPPDPGLVAAQRHDVRRLGQVQAERPASGAPIATEVAAGGLGVSTSSHTQAGVGAGRRTPARRTPAGSTPDAMVTWASSTSTSGSRGRGLAVGGGGVATGGSGSVGGRLGADCGRAAPAAGARFRRRATMAITRTAVTMTRPSCCANSPNGR